MKNPNAGNVGKLERGRSTAIVPRRSSLTQAQKRHILRIFLTARARTNPVAARLLLELGRTLAGAVAS